MPSEAVKAAAEYIMLQAMHTKNGTEPSDAETEEFSRLWNVMDGSGRVCVRNVCENLNALELCDTLQELWSGLDAEQPRS